MSAATQQRRRRLPTLGVELENKGSVARDHLASERTLLAWMRTSLALVSLGIAVAQLFKLPELIEPSRDQGQGNGDSVGQWAMRTFTLQAGETEQVWSGNGDYDNIDDMAFAGRLASLERLGKPLGALCIAMGAVCLLMGAYRYYTVQSHLMQGTFKPSRVEVSVMTLFVGAFVCAAFGVIVAVRLKN